MPPASPNVLSEADALEVIAYLVTATRTQLDEAAEYAPLRLMTAAQRLGAHLAPHASAPVRQLVDALAAMPPTATPRDREAYTAKVDEICVVLADCLLAMDAMAEPG
jgi:hypothetical protein